MFLSVVGRSPALAADVASDSRQQEVALVPRLRLPAGLREAVHRLPRAGGLSMKTLVVEDKGGERFMSLALLLARILLAAVFLVAGLAKLADLPGSRQAARDFGVPAQLAEPFGLLLPLAELAVAVALLPPVSVWWGALGALTLLLLFVGGISSNLARGRQPDCHCFGQLHSAPAGWPTLFRNLVLAAVAGVVVAFGRSMPGPGVLDWLAPLSVSQRLEVLAGLVVLALLIGEGWVLVHVLSQQGRLLLRIEALEGRLAAAGQAPSPVAARTAGLAVGSPAPALPCRPLPVRRS